MLESMFLIKYYVGGILHKVDCCIVMNIKYDGYVMEAFFMYTHEYLYLWEGHIVNKMTDAETTILYMSVL